MEWFRVVLDEGGFLQIPSECSTDDSVIQTVLKRPNSSLDPELFLEAVQGYIWAPYQKEVVSHRNTNTE